ncbi:uncharacterized protein LOC115891431 [Sitophilus oryzae]|uniref:Mitochondrial cardiolipin hydrolase n=1 Tax=Sitophilus oryzae TaxID=7048 RepID=A0A6J2YUF0_SITOR|nr:uncharacterized protein LOC115891431 [Sitophilus oryzae]
MFLDLGDILDHKYTIVTSSILLVIPIYSWKSFFSYWKQLKKEHDDLLLYHGRHNCTITYKANKGFTGWPQHMNNINFIRENRFENLYEPILYFISTAKESLDIAMMIINVNSISSEILKAVKRGVKIRIINNFLHTNSNKDVIQKLMKEGVEYQFYVASSCSTDTIMHHKFAVKDFSDTGGFMCLGSMNLTSSSVLNNYESFIFTSNYHLTEAFKNQFEDCWNNIKIDNEGLINKTILLDSHLDCSRKTRFQ